jgi:hypothetical protein
MPGSEDGPVIYWSERGVCDSINHVLTAPDPTLKFYPSSQSAAVWTAMAVFMGVLTGGSSLTQDSLALTSTLLLGIIVVWYAGYWVLSKSVYYVSSSKAGFKDFIRRREVDFSDVRSATLRIGKSRYLDFQCDDATIVRMPIDTMNDSWLSAVKAELSKRGVTVSTAAFGFSNAN